MPGGAGAEGEHFVAKAGEEDDGGFGGEFLDGVAELEAVHVGHGLVGDDEVEGLAAEDAEGGGAVGGGVNGVAVAGEEFGEEFADDVLVIDDEDAQGTVEALDGDGVDDLLLVGAGEVDGEGGADAFLAGDLDGAAGGRGDSFRVYHHAQRR